MTTKGEIKIPETATRAEIASWAREQMARLGQPVDPCVGDDGVCAILSFYLVLDGQAALALRVAEQVGLTEIAAAVRKSMPGEMFAAMTHPAATPITVLQGRLGLHSPRLVGHAITVVRGTFARFGAAYGAVSQERGVRVAAYAAKPCAPGQRNISAVWCETLFAPTRWDPAATNKTGQLGASCEQEPAESEIAASVERAKAHLLSGALPQVMRFVKVAAEPVVTVTVPAS